MRALISLWKAVRIVAVVALASTPAAATPSLGQIEAPTGTIVVEFETRGMSVRSWLEVARLDGAGRHAITAPPPAAGRVDRDPSFSPDGLYVAFLRSGSRENRHALFVASTQGPAKVERMLAANHSLVSGFAWSPDSLRIAAAQEPSVPCHLQRRSGVRLFTIELAGRRVTRVRALPSPQPPDVLPIVLSPQAWSADSRTLLVREESFSDGNCRYLGGDLRGHALFTVSTDGTSRRRVASEYFVPAARWSPAGERFALVGGTYYAGEEGCRLFVGTPEKPPRAVVRLTDEHRCGPEAGGFVWSPDGSEIFYVDGEQPGSVYAVDTRTGVRRTVVSTRPRETSCGQEILSVSSDGRFVAIYDCSRRQLYAVARDGKRTWRLPLLGAPAGASVASFDVRLD